MDLIPNGTRLFISDEPAGVLGCTLQTWYCNPKLPEQSRCVNLYESSSLERLPEIWPDAEDLAAIQGFQSAVGTFTLVQPHVLYNSPGIPSLLARSTLIGPIQLDALPPNKWQQQMEYSYQASLVSLQSAPVEVTRRGAFWPNETICPTAVACQKLCRNQASQRVPTDSACSNSSRRKLRAFNFTLLVYWGFRSSYLQVSFLSSLEPLLSLLLPLLFSFEATRTANPRTLG